MASLLPSLSSESRAHLLPLVGVVTRPCPGRNKARQARTLCSRQKHWLEFCAISAITDPVMRASSQFEHNLISACYTVYLSNGCTIKDMFIGTETIKGYLAAMAKISAKAQMIDPCKTEYGAWAPLVDKILREHRRWETMPNRREPITKAMILHWTSVAKKAHPDSFIAAFYDWMVVGKYAGFHKSEWLQDANDYKKTKDFTRNVDGTVKAFVLDDFEFSDSRHRRITTRRKSSAAKKATIRWRYQKIWITVKRYLIQKMRTTHVCAQ